MSEVKRWAHHVTWDGELKIQATMMALRSNGEYVEASDYDALATECERLRELFKESEQHLHHWQRQAAANGRSTKAMETERDAALAELAALKGGQAKPQLIIGSTYASTRGFGRLLYLGETHDIDGWLHTFRATDGARKHYRYDQLPDVLEEFAAPPAQASAWVPEGCRQVIRDLLWAGYQRPFCQDGLVERCGCWRCASKRADAALAAAPTPGASDGKGGE